MRVLIGVDGSAGSVAAARQVGKLLSSNDSIGLYCSPPAIQVRAAAGRPPEVVARARETFVRAVFDEAKGELPAALRSGVHEIVGVQEPRHGLLVAAEKWRADLIVLGARGHGSVARWLLGSVPAAVVRHAHVPVLVVRVPPERPAGVPLKVLFACDGTEVSRHAAEVLGRFTWPADTKGRTMSVVESLLGGDVPQWLKEQALATGSDDLARAWAEEQQAEIEARNASLTAYCQTLSLPFQKTSPLVVQGHAADQILKAIAVEAIDVVVLGARRLGTVARWLLGSTSEHVLAHAPCSVLIVRETESP